MESRLRIGKLAIGVLLAGWASAASGAERFAGRIIDMGGRAPGWSENFVLHIDRFSSDSELSASMAVLKEKGISGLHEALATKERGWVRIGAEPAPFYGVARSRVLPDGGRVIRILTDRAIMPIEGRSSFRRDEYRFGWIEIRLDPEGNGEGQVTAAASARLRGNEIEMVGFGEKPYQLRTVRTEKAE